MSVRGQFSSKLGFVLAAAGSAVGLGNIWGFPTQVASNGGAAFVLVYLILTFLLAYPILMAELVIGRYSQSNMVNALQDISRGPVSKISGKLTGYWALTVVCLILSFYSIVAGWMLAYALASITEVLGLAQFSQWLTAFSTPRNLLFCVIFSLLTIGIVHKGVSDGIEKWSARLMPLLLILLISLIIFVATLEGAALGWEVYVIPDFSKILSSELLISALGQAFFSLSLGVGTMLIYGSYISKKENIVTLGAQVTLVDIGIAILAGMLIIPAMYVAQHNGVTIFTESGELINGDRLIFTVIPELFNAMGNLGNVISFIFFSLMAIAAVTSSISMLEVPVAYTVENSSLPRSRATWLIGGFITLISSVIIFNFELLFGAVVAFTTQYSQPLLGLVLSIFVGWVWRRNVILNELKEGCPEVESSLFWKIWPSYVRFVCPVVISVMFYHSIFS
ncbi:sodium-dependent transporter [Shewanella sp. D64]|uniref:sodium-dependent transporter n=1 Tax=unclassified Shewanella TaxID=196818 RepID=UPI0022BA502C|nr:MULTISPECIES: sodium-dependent transporter [unclassified Shewanella]MEC4727094.1 sodium-dependent transporter [Shewanella sp. D64]MEC4737833.1 sodium-dependent transporter [Shewanella sp. E94]WBJ93911.1 sodium-dependent transporter [Shewanella sp. MTB7]